jgi:microcystin-dependent protein
MKKTTKRLIATALVLATSVSAASADEPFVGEIRTFGFGFCPRGWAALDGQLLAISTNDALFSLLGTIYGGDGRTTFGLPDMRGRIAVHTGNGPGLTSRPMGQKSGTETVTMTSATMPRHTHVAAGGSLNARLVASSEAPDTNNPSGAYLPTAATNFYAPQTGGKKDMAPDMITIDLAGDKIDFSGGSSPASQGNMAPYQANNYCISLFGVYPSRS